LWAKLCQEVRAARWLLGVFGVLFVGDILCWSTCRFKLSLLDRSADPLQPRRQSVIPTTLVPHVSTAGNHVCVNRLVDRHSPLSHDWHADGVLFVGDILCWSTCRFKLSLLDRSADPLQPYTQTRVDMSAAFVGEALPGGKSCSLAAWRLGCRGSLRRNDFRQSGSVQTKGPEDTGARREGTNAIFFLNIPADDKNRSGFSLPTPHPIVSLHKREVPCS
jgi:hypothetical protein